MTENPLTPLSQAQKKILATSQFTPPLTPSHPESRGSDDITKAQCLFVQLLADFLWVPSFLKQLLSGVASWPHQLQLHTIPTLNAKGSLGSTLTVSLWLKLGHLLLSEQIMQLESQTEGGRRQGEIP